MTDEKIEKLVEYISENAKNVIVMTGAGISVSSLVFLTFEHLELVYIHNLKNMIYLIQKLSFQ